MDPIVLFFQFHFVLFVIACAFVLSSKQINNDQRGRQMAFSLFLPFIGPVATIFVHVTEFMSPERLSERYMGQSIDEVASSHSAWHLNNH